MNALRGLVALLLLLPFSVIAQNTANYRLGPADVVKISVYNNPDPTTEAQITSVGKISFPPIGKVEMVFGIEGAN
jgi:polysaccharide export outer membrane protein